jgi:hypothetical protein
MTASEGLTLAGARKQLAILCGLAFVAGTIAGLLLSRPLLGQGSRQPGWTNGDRLFFEQFSEEFGLSAEQRRLLRVVLEERRGKLSNWQNDLRQMTAGRHARQELLRINRRQDSRIRALLTTAQRRHYDDVVARRNTTNQEVERHR